MNFATALAVFASKGPVCVCTGGTGCKAGLTKPRNFCGPQRKTLVAARVIEAVVAIPAHVESARRTGLVYHREEFDSAMSAWAPTVTVQKKSANQD